MSLFSPSSGNLQAIPVAALAGMIAEAVATGLPQKLRVKGEVSNFSNRRHWYFTLKDADAQLRAIMWESRARGVNFQMKDGLSVIVTGRVEFWPQGGSVQFYADAIEQAGIGDLETELRRRMLFYREKGYFAPESKKKLPSVPRKIAVVTSRSAAALQDVINTAGKRWKGCQLVLVDVRVQGGGAGGEIARALAALSAQGAGLGIDAVLLTRGGGSIEDLWAFNEAEVVEAVHACSLPVVAAIGHETDTTLAELAADLRCATPTQAAMTLIPDEMTLRQQYEPLGDRLRLGAQRLLREGKQRLAGFARHPMFRDPRGALEPARRRLDGFARHPFFTQSKRITHDRRLALDALRKRLDALSPKSVLNRGFSYTVSANGVLLRNESQAIYGMELRTHLMNGVVVSTVGAKPLDGQGVPVPVRLGQKHSKKRAPKIRLLESGGLFG